MNSFFLDKFFHVVRQYPSIIAIDEGEGKVTDYASLGRRVRRLAYEFCKFGGDAPRVLIYMPKQADAYAAMFAALMAGGFYTPVNSSISIQRISHIMRTLRPDIVLTNRDFWMGKPELAEPASSAHILYAEDIDVSGNELINPRPPHRLGYVMFTSGTTGLPKGVMISQTALEHYVRWVLEEFGLTVGDRCSQHPNIGFDVSVTDIYGALLSGATLVPIKSELERLFPARAIKERHITVWNSVPSVVSLMMRARQLTQEYLQTLRLFVFLGEPLLPEHLEAIFSARPDLTVYNTYGPTEATVAVTAIRLKAENYQKHCRHNVTLGMPFGQNRLYLSGGETPDEGEVVIAGPQLADGYLKDQEKTQSSFRPLPESKENIAYFTGDWARKINGDIYFISRIDFQVKIRGHRLELGEVDAALRKAGLGNVASIAHKDQVIAFVEGVPEALKEPKTVRKTLRRYLEEYAIPTRFIVVDSLPRNANDKIDIKELARLYESGAFDDNPTF